MSEEKKKSLIFKACFRSAELHTFYKNKLDIALKKRNLFQDTIFQEGYEISSEDIRNLNILNYKVEMLELKVNNKRISSEEEAATKTRNI